MRIAGLIACAALASGCGESVDTAGLPSVEGYTDWHRIDVTGEAPGHGDTYRIIYVNETGRGYGHAGLYPPDTVLVKEIRALAADDQPGDLRYIAIMRKLADDDAAASDLPIDDDWLFTRADEPGGAETSFDFCWARCHVQAPVDGAFYDYGR